jgi:hypothetical protein
MQQLWRPGFTSVTRNAADGATQLNAGGYGFGLRISESCSYRHIVSHGGGLPGFGSVMSWLPEYGVGIIAFGNLTYAGWGRMSTVAFDALVNTGGVRPHSPKPSDALNSARDAVSKLIVRWDDRVADTVAAENLFLDRSRERRRAEIDGLRARVGACTPGGGFDTVENALRGQWTMSCERGRLQVAITLAPTTPPKVQFLSVRAAPDSPQRGETCQ